MLKAIFLLLAVCTLTLAADISGDWTFEVVTDAGSGSPTFTFNQSGEKLTGRYTGLFGSADVTGTVRDSAVEFSFEVSQGDQKVKIVYKGTVETALSMKGSVELGSLGKGTWTAKKK